MLQGGQIVQNDQKPLDLKPGIYDIPEDEYHRLTAFSNTDLKLVAQSPAHYWAERIDPERPADEPTAAKIAGRILHCAILEPDTFSSKFVVVPEDAPRKPSSTQRGAKKPSEDTIRAILYWDEFNLQHEGKTIIKHEDYVECQKITNSIRNHKELRGLFTGGLSERTFIAEDPVTGVLVRCRTDLINTLAGHIVVIDLKSCMDARNYQFRRACYKYGYFHQDAFYRDVISWSGWGEIDLFMFVAFEKKSPYAAKPYYSTDAAIERARREYRESLNTAAECLNTGIWPAYSTDIEALDYPA